MLCFHRGYFGGIVAGHDSLKAAQFRSSDTRLSNDLMGLGSEQIVHLLVRQNLRFASTCPTIS